MPKHHFSAYHNSFATLAFPSTARRLIWVLEHTIDGFVLFFFSLRHLSPFFSSLRQAPSHDRRLFVQPGLCAGVTFSFYFTSSRKVGDGMRGRAPLPFSHSWFQESGAFPWAPEWTRNGNGHFWGHHFGRFLFLLKLLHSWVCVWYPVYYWR
jgi:hypothetical protein